MHRSLHTHTHSHSLPKGHSKILIKEIRFFPFAAERTDEKVNVLASIVTIVPPETSGYYSHIEELRTKCLGGLIAF